MFLPFLQEQTFCQSTMNVQAEWNAAARFSCMLHIAQIQIVDALAYSRCTAAATGLIKIHNDHGQLRADEMALACRIPKVL